jgi:hypothetical protein
MISISTKVDKGGFWYFVDALEDSKVTLSYIVIGTGGRQGSGEIEGSSSKLKDWQYVEVGFPVLHVGVTDVRINRHLPGDALAPKPRPLAEQLSRRKSIKNITAMLLAGWAMMMFPTGLSHGRAVTEDREPTPGSSGDAAGRFNPYSAESGDLFNPY